MAKKHSVCNEATLYITVEEYKERTNPLNLVGTIHLHTHPSEGCEVMLFQNEEVELEEALEKLTKRVDKIVDVMRLEIIDIKLVMKNVVDIDEKEEEKDES